MSATDAQPLRERLGIGYHALLLGGIATLATSALVFGDRATRDAIAERRAEDLERSLAQVLPASLHDNNLVADTLTLKDAAGKPRAVYVAKQNGKVTGAAFETVGKGYAGDIVVIMAVDRDGAVVGTRVIRHQETPGLGDKIEIAKSPWIDSFKGRSLANLDRKGWQVKKDGGVFDQFTGATITPRAVVTAVRDGLDFFAEHRAEIIDGKAASAEAK